MVQITAFDGQTLSALGIICGVSTNENALTTEIDLFTRNDSFPKGFAKFQKELYVNFQLIPTGGTSLETFYTNVNQYFAPNGGIPSVSNKRRVIAGLHNDGATTINALGYISSLRRIQRNVYEGVFIIPDGHWVGTISQSDSVSPVANNGNHKTYPMINLTYSTNSKYRTFQVNMSGVSEQLHDYPITFTTDTTGTSATVASRYIMFINGVSVPFIISVANDVTTKFWVRVNIPKGGTITGTLFYGSAISNPKCSLFSDTDSLYKRGGMDLTNSTNSIWRWNSFELSSFPFSCGVWKPGKIGISQPGTSYGMTSEASAGCTFTIEDDDSLYNDSDSMILVVGGSGGSSGSSLTGLSRTLTLQDSDGIIRSFVRYRTKNSPIWKTAYSLNIDSTTISSFPSSGGAITSAISFGSDNPIEIAVGVEPQESQPRGSLALTNSGNFEITLVNPVNISVSGANNSFAKNDNYHELEVINNSNSFFLTIGSIFITGLTLILDCKEKNIIWGGWAQASIYFKNLGEDWLYLSPGSSTFSWNAISPTTEFVYYYGYLL